MFGQLRHRFGVVNLAGGQLARDDLVQIIEDQMELETEEPAHRGFAARRQAGEGLMTIDAVIVTHRQSCAVDVIDTGLFAQAAEQEEHQWYKSPFLYRHKLLVAGHAGKRLTQQGRGKIMVEVLQIFAAGTM